MNKLTLFLFLAGATMLPGQTSKTVQYDERDVVRVNAKLRFTTMVVLPKTEQILDFVVGDKEFWVVEGNHNFALIKPAKAGSQTNVNLITASGAIYSLLVAEVGQQGEPDLKVFIEPKDAALLSSGDKALRFIDAKQIDDYRQQVEIAKAAERKAEADAEAVKQQYAH
jgi:type IV secretory pathway VirB9-like protein